MLHIGAIENLVLVFVTAVFCYEKVQLSRKCAASHSH